MPLRTENPILSVEFGSMVNIDTSSAENLFGLWSMFSKCSGSMRDGARLENLSWRLWNRETLCCAPEHTSSHWSPSTRSSTSLPTSTALQRASRTLPVPDLVPSLSVDSESDDEDLPASEVPLCNSRLQIRGKALHITPVDLDKIVTSITEKQTLEPLSPLPQSLALPTRLVAEALPIEAATIPESSASTIGTVADTLTSSVSPSVVGSTPSTATEMSSHSVVRGFEPGRVSSSFRSKSQLNTSHTPTSMLQQLTPQEQDDAMKRKGATFTIGGGSSDEEAESTLEAQMRRAANQKLMSSTDKARTVDRSQPPSVPQTNDSSAVESDDEDEVSESAIEDEDDEDDDDEDDDAWEDSSDNGEASADEKKPSPTFERVESSANLVSRRSLLTMQMNDPQVQNPAARSTPALRRSRTSTPNGPSLATSPLEGNLEINPSQITRSRPIIMTTSNTHPPALSPRTTRRNMLSTELTESLRKNLLWERQQKNSTSHAAAAAAAANIKRRHTSNDVKSLHQFPDTRTSRLPTVRETTKPTNSWNHYFDNGLQEYHEKGW